MAERLSELADALWPHLARKVGASTGSATGTLASPTDHGGLTGLLDDDHPGYLTPGRGDARYPALTDWTAHIGNADAHHARSHVLATNVALGDDHTISGATTGYVLRASSATAAAFARLQHSDLGGISANQHHNQIHSITGTDHTISAAAMQVVGATATDTLGLLTPLSAPGEASAILKSDSTGKLTLPLMVASTNLQTPLIIAGTGQSLTLQPPLDLIFDPASNRAKMAADVSIEASAYASQTTGWRVTDAGEADFRYLYVDEMHAKSFIADLEQALAGGQIIAKSVAVLYSDFTAPAAGATAALTVRDLPSATGMAVFVDGDYIRLRKFDRSGGSLIIGDCWGTVVLDTSYGASGFDSATKSQRYTFTRSAAPDAGAMTAGTVVYAESIILDYGTAGNGIYEVNAIDGLYALNSPYAQVATWSTHPRSMTVKSRLGNLRGIFSIADEYGLYAGSGTGNADRYIRASNEAIELRNVPLALYSGNDNTMLLSAGAGNNSPFLALGNPLPTGPLTNNGIWAGLDGSDYEFRVGTVSGGALVKGLHWSGSDLTWKATNTSLDASGNLVAGPVTLSGDGVTSAVTTGYANNTAYKFTYGGAVTSGLWAYADTAGTQLYLSSNRYGGVSTVQSAALNAYVQIASAVRSGKQAYAYLDAEAVNEYGQTIKLARIVLAANSATSAIDLNADSVEVNSKAIWHADMDAHLLPATDVTYNLGSAAKQWATVYANNMIISGSISGATLGGAEWQHGGSMIIDANAASNTTVSIVNQNAGAYTASLDVEGNITLGGNVDGVDLSAFKTAYDSHNHDVRYYTETELQTSGFAVVHWGNLSSKPTTFAPSAHAYDDAAHTGTLSWSKVSKTGSNLNEIATRSHTVLSDIGNYTHANIDTHINTADTHVAHSGVSILGGNGLTGGGAINSTQTLHVAVSGLGLSVGADAVTLSSSSAPGVAASILATNSSGGFALDGSMSQRGWLRIKNMQGLYADDPRAALIFGATDNSDSFYLGAITNDTRANTTLGLYQWYPFANWLQSWTADGKVGIRKTDPAYIFDVNGTGRFTSTLYADDDLYVADLLDVGGNLTVGAGAGVLRVLGGSGQARVGINCDADSQFSLDIAGAARAQYWVGPHALQLDGAVAIMHFDGAAPYNRDFSGTPDTHMGVRGTTTGHVLYRPGKFGKAVQVAEGTTNLFVNPSFEVALSTGWATSGGSIASSGGLYGASYLNAGSYTFQSVTISNGATYTFSFYHKGSYSLNYSTGSGGLIARGASGIAVDSSGWKRCTETFVATGTTFTLYMYGLPYDAFQLEQKSYASPYHDGSITTLSSWDGTPHASTSTRTAGSVYYPTPMTGDVGSVFFWFKRSRDAAWRPSSGVTYESLFECNYGSGGPLVAIANGTTYSTLDVYGMSSGISFPTTINAERWYFFALTWDGTTVTATLGDDSGIMSSNSQVQAASRTFGTDVFWLGTWSGGSPFSGLIDELVILDRAATDKEILSIYASNAPVFAESSVFSFRAPMKSNLRVDEYGMWFTGAAGGEIFGMYGGDPARVLTTQSWGGVTMEEGDVVIGRTTDSGAALHWDDSERKLRLGVQAGNHLELTSTTFKIKAGTVEKISLDGSGNASITGTLAMGASGSITGTSYTINQSGIQIISPSAWDAGVGYKFLTSSTIHSGLWSQNAATGGADNRLSLYVNAQPDGTTAFTDRSSYCDILAKANGTTPSAHVTLNAIHNTGGTATVGVYAGSGFTEVTISASQVSVGAAGGTTAVPNLYGSGNRAVYSTSNGTLTNSSSDKSMKKNTARLSDTLALVESLEPISYYWRDKHQKKLGSQREIGLIAQDVQRFLPEIIGENGDGTLALDYSRLSVVLIGAVQELSARVRSLESLTLTLSKGR